MSALTQDQKEKYLKAGGSVCPFCQATDICGDGIDVDGPFASQEVDCADCGESWTDIYKLFEVES